LDGLAKVVTTGGTDELLVGVRVAGRLQPPWIAVAGSATDRFHLPSFAIVDVWNDDGEHLTESDIHSQTSA
jgi:hypothetical protein